MSQGEEATKSLFELAGFTVLKVWRLENQYWPRVDAYLHVRAENPWFLVKVDEGLIEFGPRKRVYAIDWKHTHMRGHVTNEDVTKEDDYVHAWSLTKALEYLTKLKEMANAQSAKTD